MHYYLLPLALHYFIPVVLKMWSLSSSLSITWEVRNANSQAPGQTDLLNQNLEDWDPATFE